MSKLKKKMVVLQGDFNAGLLKYDHVKEANFLDDAIYSKLILPNNILAQHESHQFLQP